MNLDYKLKEGIYARKLQDNEYEILKEIQELQSTNGTKANQLMFDTFGIGFHQIIAAGNSDDPNYDLLRVVIPPVTYNKAPGKPKGYKCYVIDDASMTIHEDRRSSWKCFIEYMGNPDKIIIFKK